MMNFNDQDPMATPEEKNSSSTTYATSSKIMISAIVILFFVVILIVFLHLYARWYLLCARRRHLRRRNRRATMVFFAADPSTVIPTRGLDPAVIKSLPVFTFSAATQKDPIECAVCLSGFEETESGRVLPGCKHTFHVDCIDMWFHSHSTCPLCRSLVEPHARSETPTAEEEQVVITISSEPVCATEPGSSSGLSDEPEDLGRKPAAIEVPRRNFSEFEHESTQSSPFRSPMMSRMLSFTRMLSRDRRNASSPVAGASPLSPSWSCQIPMAEPDIERGEEQTM
ncbi:hypothetical protein Bca4012_004301 [Brassica carinata]|uniref:RING-type E3 ubiquitin transferase n=3 Tax=Brassica TaxID=3705 RepID=A0A0D3BBN8_BRAOL|nr:PREDICTED: RING-H2 finger protein ATL2-like [Brassica oleracea var. oleracea]KAG2294610.1 hypothetical protein Bca52824_041279 [Brassica carinata]VDC93777.1 unnamed protein product [Brassica oleracea]